MIWQASQSPSPAPGEVSQAASLPLRLFVPSSQSIVRSAPWLTQASGSQVPNPASGRASMGVDSWFQFQLTSRAFAGFFSLPSIRRGIAMRLL